MKLSLYVFFLLTHHKNFDLGACLDISSVLSRPILVRWGRAIMTFFGYRRASKHLLGLILFSIIFRSVFPPFFSTGCKIHLCPVPNSFPPLQIPCKHVHFSPLKSIKAAWTSFRFLRTESRQSTCEPQRVETSWRRHKPPLASRFFWKLAQAGRRKTKWKREKKEWKKKMKEKGGGWFRLVCWNLKLRKNEKERRNSPKVCEIIGERAPFRLKTGQNRRFNL